MPQRDDPPTPSSFAEATEDKWLRRTGAIEAIKRLEPPSRVRYGVSGALLEYAVMHGDDAERIRDERTGGCVGFAEGCGGRGASALPARG
ncbi:MAG: hypothetical protein IJJ84_02740 [Kiritimatiellae bacterium]|nr:hypothetical protein [Kiritimatiellia bacterium]